MTPDDEFFRCDDCGCEEHWTDRCPDGLCRDCCNEAGHVHEDTSW